MEIDVIYRIPKDFCWQYIKKFVKPAIIDLAIYHSSPDYFITKKTIWNAAGRIAPGGIFCIRVFPENMSDVIKLVEEQGYKYRLIYFNFFGRLNDSIVPFLIGYKNEILKPNLDTLIHIRNMDDIGYKLINLCQYGGLVLCVGDATIQFADMSKKLGRNVIGLGDNPAWISLAEQQGVRRIEI